MMTIDLILEDEHAGDDAYVSTIFAYRIVLVTKAGSRLSGQSDNVELY